MSSTDNEHHAAWNALLRKIWISDIGLPYASFFPSIRIDYIYGDVISGFISLRGIGMPPVFNDENEYIYHNNRFTANINYNTAFGRFTDWRGRQGSFTLYHDEYYLYINVSFNDESHNYTLLVYDEYIRLRPHSLSDFDYFDITHNLIVETNFDAWGGNVRIVPGVFHGRVSFPAIYLTDLNNNILYQFNFPVTNGTWVHDIIVYDFNNDGILDVKIAITGGVDYSFSDSSIEPTEHQYWYWYFYQIQNGWFVISAGVNIP